MVSVWRMGLCQCQRALEYRRKLQADLRQVGRDDVAAYWQRDVDRLLARRADLVAWLDSRDGGE